MMALIFLRAAIQHKYFGSATIDDECEGDKSGAKCKGGANKVDNMSLTENLNVTEEKGITCQWRNK